MKLMAILLLAFSMHVGAKSWSQSVTFSGENVSLEKAFDAIEKQTGYVVFYDYRQINGAKPVTISVKNEPLASFLQLCFKDQPFGFAIEDKTIVITAKGRNNASAINSITAATPIDVKGRILNENNEPVVASIVVKGTQNGTTSNNDGNFELKNVDENATLVISGVSIETIEIAVNGRTSLTVNVKTRISEGEEVTVKTNYWETKQRLNTGNISKVTAKEIERNPVSNPLATLQGKVAGLEVTQENGVPGSGFIVRIRGRNSISSGLDPLYVIDGVPYTSTTLSSQNTSGGLLSQDASGRGGVSPLNYINPADIESIEVLKDAVATAIYGSRGSNGVVLITTKKGRAGKTKVDVNFYTGFSQVGNRVDLLNTPQYMQMRREAKQNDNTAIAASDYDLNGAWDTTRYTDWQKELIGGTARTTDAQLSFSGGNHLLQYRIGGGYHRETTVFPGDNSDQRISAQASLSATSPNQKLRTSLSLNYSSGSSDLLSNDLTKAALSLAPVAPAVYNNNGELNWQNNSWDNPLRYTTQRYEANTRNLIANFSLNYEILEGLHFRTNAGLTNTTMKSTLTQPIRSFRPDQIPIFGHGSVFGNNDFYNWTVEPQLNYIKTVGKGELNVMAGTSFFGQRTEGTTTFGEGFPSEALLKNLGAASAIRGFNTYSQYKYSSLFGRINYIHNQKYIIDLTARRDGSSRFGQNKPFANFGAAGAAWVFSKEKFIENALPFLSYGKLRTSYGTVGNDQIGDYGYLDTYRTDLSYMGNSGLFPVRLANSDFSWEVNKKFEGGIELGFIKDRILASISFYRNRTSSQLVGIPLPPTTGFRNINANLPATVQNTGLEIELTTKNFQSTSFSWVTSFNISIPRNKLLAFPGLEGSSYANSFKVGEPLNITKLYHYLGVDPQTGLYQFEDVNQDGAYNQADRHMIKFLGAKFFGGLNNSFQYKGLQLDVLLQFVKQEGQNDIVYLSSTPGVLWAQGISVLERWQKPGDLTNIQRYGVSSAATTAFSSRFLMSDGHITDKSFIRVKNVSLSWSLSDRLTRNLHIDGARLFVRCQNLFTITDFKGLDPEVVAANGALAPLRTISVGMNLTL